MTSHGLQVLDRAECLTLLRSRSLGRVGVAIAGDIVILPVYYAMVDDDVVFQTGPGTKLDAAVLQTRVAFEIDNAVPAWSVLVTGHAREIREHAEQVRARSHLGHDWPVGERERLVRLAAEQVSGRRIPNE